MRVCHLRCRNNPVYMHKPDRIQMNVYSGARYLCLSVALLAFASCQGVTESGPAGTDLLPLKENNSWTYERSYFVRGTVNSIDTIVVTVEPALAYLGHASVYPVRFQGSHSINTIYVKRKSSDHFVRIESDSSETSIIGTGKDAAAEFLPTIFDGGSYVRYYSTLDDSVAEVQGREHHARRVAQWGELRFNGQKLLTLKFDNAFVPGLGQVSSTYVADLAECQSCVLTTEFRTYRLIDLHVE